MLMDKNLLIKVNRIKLNFERGANDQFKTAAKAFFKGDTGAFGPYVSTKNALVYRVLSTVDGYNQEAICLRLVQDGEVLYLGNSSRFQFVGSKVAFGDRHTRWGDTPEQRTLVNSGVSMLPFDAFREAGLNLTETVVMDRGGAETVRRITGHDRQERPIFQDVHFTGSSLFKNGNKTFLFDIDRGELVHGIFNPFIVELGRPAETIAEAYAGLKPDAVRDAEAQGFEVLRQGEFFLVKRAEVDAYKPDVNTGRSWDRDNGQVQGRLAVQGNRAHLTTAFHGKTGYVSGTLTHTGREHAPLELKGWFQVYPNTAASAFTLTGDVD